MASPYWGQLPPLQVNRTASVKRDSIPGRQGDSLTIDTNTNRNRLSGQSLSRRNRNSAQTDAPTLSTQSPFASPTASSFRGDGLAPRPSSFQQEANDTAYNKDYLERRRRREARNSGVYDDNPPPAAPEVPRAPPPVSYKQPYSNGAYTAPVRSRSMQKSEGPLSPAEVPGEYHRSDTSVEHASAGRAGSKGKQTDRPGAGERNQGRRPSESRKGSVSETETQRRREWAPDRSPLQRLELTLDSITKEEKRARVEEAELLAREAKAGRGGERATQNSVRFRNRPVAKGTNTSQPEPETLPDAGLVRNLSTKQKDQLQRSGTVERKQPISSEPSNGPGAASRGFDYQPDVKSSPQSQNYSAPRRENSTSENPALPKAGSAAFAATPGVNRSRSNKLKKDPPGDPWFSRRADAEKQYPEIIPLRGKVLDSRAGIVQDKDLPSLPKEARAPAYPINSLDLDSDQELDTRPVRRGSSKKIEQLTGEKSLSQDARAIPSNQMNGERVNFGRTTSQREPGNALRTESATNIRVKYALPPSSASGQNQVPRGANEHHHFPNILHRHDNRPTQGVYVASRRLEEWKKGGVVLLDGAMLDLDVTDATDADKDKAWWEAGNVGRRRSSTTKQRKAEAYDAEFDGSNAPTRFKPPLFLKAGPLLRYCGLRRERKQGRIPRDAPRPEREIWRGSLMIVTQDSNSSYELAPTLRLFVQPMDLLPPPPAEVDGSVAPEYVDPIAGLPKVGRDGRTLYIRPVEHLQEQQDLSREESDDGLFETVRSPLDGGSDPKSNYQKLRYDGEKAGKYKEIRGFRLHAEHGVTFWKFNLEIELREKQQRIAYRINRGPATGFWVPARDQAMNIMFHSCNGFSHGVDPNAFSGPDPMWRDVLNTHQTQPFHVMLGGGDQIYNDAVQHETTIFEEWTEIRDSHHKENEPFTPELQEELEKFYLNRYAMWFSQGLFGLATSQIPMINIFDDHDIIDGFGSYSDRYMRCPVMSGLGAVAFKYYMLFQHQSSIDEGEETEPSWILGDQPGPYIPELSRSIFTFLGRSIAFLGLDCRTERMYDEVVSPETYDKVFARLEKEIIKGETKHLIVLLGVPIAYPRMVWLENILTSRLMDPVKALGRAGLLGKGLLNHLDGGVEILDDLDDHWTAKHHKDERQFLIEELQELAAEKSVRITFLGGDVHLAAIGQFYSNPKLGIRKDRDHRYMPNVISSAIVNTPPPDALADLLNKRNKIHHLDSETDEDMIPIFTHDVTGKPRNNKRLLNRRNWCSIRLYNPELSPPPTPDEDSDESTSSPPVKRGLLRRFSSSRGPGYRPEGTTDRPPLSSTNFFSRQPSGAPRSSTDTQRSGILTRTLSLTRKDFIPSNFLRRNSKRRRDDGINGYNSESDDESFHEQQPQSAARFGIARRGSSGDVDYGTHPIRSGIRGGGTEEDGYFPTMPRPLPNKARTGSRPPSLSGPRQTFHRTPTGLSEKQVRKGNQEINLEGGLDVCLNVEVSPKDPAGITVPYRLLVPRLWYEEAEEGLAAKKMRGSMKRWVQFAKEKGKFGRWRESHGPGALHREDEQGVVEDKRRSGIKGL